MERILSTYKIVNEDLFTLAMELFERKYTKSIISAIWIIVRLTDHIPQKLWSKCKGVIEELIKKKKAKSNLGRIIHSCNILVRKELALSLKIWLNKEGMELFALKMLKLLLNDSNENETVRINALDVMISKVWENKIFMKDMYKALKVLLGFVSWRIKYVLAKNMG